MTDLLTITSDRLQVSDKFDSWDDHLRLDGASEIQMVHSQTIFRHNGYGTSVYGVPIYSIDGRHFSCYNFWWKAMIEDDVLELAPDSITVGV